ncbi:MAG: SMP-30/gluconolactonase/LRE family protein [Chloroflexota bacterium]
MSTQISDLQVFKVGNSPEDVLPNPDGSLYTGLADGRILRIAEDGSTTQVADTGGRPLGLEWHPDGRIIVCDARLGLLIVAPESGRIETLVAYGDASLSICNNPAIATDGRIFFSDSSQRNLEGDARRDLIDAIPTGRLLCRHPDGRVEVLMDELLFANGVVVAPDQSFVLIAETGKACIHRYWLEGEKAGQRDIFAADLVGLPDNLTVGSDGLLWVALASPNSPLLARIHAMPKWLRFVVARLPQWIEPEQDLCCQLAAFDFDGNLIHDFEGDVEQYHFVTGVRELDGVVYMGTFEGNSVARFELT